ncbi:FMN reductase [Agromyces albus]|uniref:FMN reductase n=1 Tax=Agromyces albus TaxID=205332 RepID=UPI00277E0329|nr:FMN reductase [Agromyces albus]MDQ0574232.1 FMN reductase [Agromyces albus]
MTTKPLDVVAVVGSLHAPSKTAALIDAIVDRLGTQLPVDVHVIRLAEVGPAFAGTLRRDQLPESVELELRAIERADLLVVATPVYRASFTGLFKHLFDFVEQYALVDTPVLLAATGGSERHALILEHQLRPLFGFFQAVTLPLGVYAHDSDFVDYRVASPLLFERIDNAIRRGLPLIRSSLAEQARIERTLEAGTEPVVEPAQVLAGAQPVRLYT